VRLLLANGLIGDRLIDQLSAPAQAAVIGAYGFRRLRAGYAGPLVRLRRSTDNVEADFGSGLLRVDTAEIAAWRGAGTAFVRTLYDQSGNARHLVQPTALNQPAFTASGVGGRAGADFDGTYDVMTAYALAPLVSGTDLPVSIVAVARPDVVSGGRTIAAFGNSTVTNPLHSLDANAGRWRLIKVDTAGLTATSSLHVATAARNVVHIASHTGTNSQVTTGEIEPTSTALAMQDVGATSYDRFAVGALVRTTSVNFFDGVVSEIVVLSAALTDADRATLMAGLSAAYSVTMPTIRTLAAVAAQTLPDGQGSVAGKGFTGTGLDYDDADNRLWIANDGRANASSTNNASLVQVSLDGQTKFTEISIEALSPAAGTVQGVAFDSSNGTLWCASPAENKLHNVSRAGALLGSLTLSGVALNGLAYDSARDRLWLLNGSDLRRYTKAGVLELTVVHGIPNTDQLYYEDGADILWLTSGQNGTAMKVYSYTCSTGAIGTTVFTFADAQSAQGCAKRGTTVYVTHNGFFHSSSPPFNQLQRYQID